jgi:hypothetical protein
MPLLQLYVVERLGTAGGLIQDTQSGFLTSDDERRSRAFCDDASLLGPVIG